MDDININSGSSTSAINSEGSSSPSAAITTSSQITDTLAAAILASESNELSVFHTLKKPLDLVSWSKHQTTNSLEAKIQQFNNDTASTTALTGMRINTIVTAENLIELESKFFQIADQMASLYQQQVLDNTSVNTGIIVYNLQISQITDDDQAQIDTMNAATIAYTGSDHGSGATATYNQAIADYNTYINTTRITNYNNATNALNAYYATYIAAVAAQNAQIDLINVDRLQAGLPPLPHVSSTMPFTPAQTTMPAAPSTSSPVAIPNAPIPSPVVSVAAPTPPPSGADLVTQYLAPVLDALIANSEIDSDFYNTLTTLRDFIRYYLGPLSGKVSNLPNAFIDRADEVFLDKSVGVGSGAGASLSSIIAGLSSPNLNRLLYNSIATDAALKANALLPADLVDTIRLINLTLLSRAGLASSLPALGILAEKAGTIDSNSPTLQIALSLSFVNQIAKLNDADDIKKAILKHLQAANPSVAAEQLEKLADILAASSKLSLSLFGLSSLAQSLNFPELTAQLVGQINHPAVTTALQSAAATTTADILGNPSSSAHLREDLANHIYGLGNFSRNTADDIAKTIQLHDINDAAGLKASINRQLIAKGINDNDANKLSDRAVEYTKSEINGAYILDSATQKEQIQKDSLTQELRQRGIAEDQIAKTVTDVTNESNTSRRQLRDRIANSLEVGGTPSASALQIATEIAVNGQSANLNYTRVPSNELAASIATRVTNQASDDYGNLKAQQLGEQVADALLGNEISNPLSTVNTIQASIAHLNTVNDEKVAENIRAFLKPAADLYKFNVEIQNPANNLILSMLSGPMYPSNYIKHTGFIDIVV